MNYCWVSPGIVRQMSYAGNDGVMGQMQAGGGDMSGGQCRPPGAGGAGMGDWSGMTGKFKPE
eukprot:10095401-Heterocapsa_arctica.AAC.1